MSQDNVEFVKAALGGFLATGEVPWDAFDEQVQVVDHDIPERGDYVGHPGVGRWLQDWSEPWSDWTLEPEEWIDGGDEIVVVIARMTATGRGSGVRLERHDGLVHTVRGDKISRLEYFNSREDALAAAGIST